MRRDSNGPGLEHLRLVGRDRVRRVPVADLVELRLVGLLLPTLLQALRWANVDLIENRLRVVDSKTETGERSVALARSLAEQLWQRRRTCTYRADGDRVFCHAERGSVDRYETFADVLRRAYKAAAMTFPEGMRPFHDLRVTSITNDAIAGANPVALMTKAGHASMATTRRYLRLAGTVFPDEAAALDARVLGRP